MVALLLPAFLSAGSARATLPISNNYGSLPQVINTICLTCVKVTPGTDGGTGRAAAPTPAAPQSLTTTRFTASPAVSARVKTLFVQRAAKIVSPEQTRQIAAALAGIDVESAWAALVAGTGLRPGDVADAIASYYVGSWVVANQGDSTTAQTLAVRDGLRRALAEPLAAAPDAERQAYAEAAMLGFLLTVKPYADARKAGDAATAQALSDQAEANFLAATHVDLRRLALTDRGFAPKP
jgi:hypothetical protein